MIKRSNLSIVLLLTILLSTATFGQSNAVSRFKSGKTDRAKVGKDSKENVTIERIERDISEALTLIQDNHYAGDDLNYNELFKTSIDSMLHTLDPHSNYFDAKEFQKFRTSQNSRYFGIGATINSLRDKNRKIIGTFIKATFNGAPANRAGLRYGDKIVEVNGVSVLGRDYPFVRERLLGPRGTVAKIVVKKHGTGKRELVEIVRDAVSTPSIQAAYMVRPDIGYIAMTGGFNRTTYNEFRGEMSKLKSAGMKQLVLDLRFNGGGLVNQAFYVANTFLDEGQTVFTQKGRLRGTERTYRAENTNPDNTPLVVLINGSTASASEILAGALQDHDRALIVGETSFGKGLVQNPYRLEYDTMLLLTIAKYETPAGRLIQKDYSDGNLYNYYTNGGTLEDGEKPKKPKGAEKQTDSGRVVYGGGGIAPDVVVKPERPTPTQNRRRNKLAPPLVSFAMDLAYGKIKGFERYTVNRPITFNYDLKSSDFPIDSRVFAAFKKYAVSRYGIKAKQVDLEKQYVERILRSELVTAAFGRRTFPQVYNQYDPQLNKAIELLPKAKRLAMRGAEANAARRLQTNKK